MDRQFLIDKKAFQVQYHCRVYRMNKHPCSNRTIPSCEMARTLTFIYYRFDGNSFTDVGEKHVGLDKRKQASQKEHVLSLLRLSQLSTPFGSFNFRPTFACSLILAFSFLVRFFRFFELVQKTLNTGRLIISLGNYPCCSIFKLKAFILLIVINPDWTDDNAIQILSSQYNKR